MIRPLVPLTAIAFCFSLTSAQVVYRCNCALFRENGFLDEVNPLLDNLGATFIDLGERTECNNGDLTTCDQYCRQYIKDEGFFLGFDSIRDGTETYGEHFCEQTGLLNPNDLPIETPGNPVFAFSRMEQCTTIDTTWFTFPDSQFDPPFNLCCDAAGQYVPCN
ncbi:unnamed protein product [Owenia fusiformis]|uniref:Uncharacterized protein n=1 Tax=Owenia fusiformis TaxID=6347 RepID=A0A8S4PIZ1_OWEFU|nr:unnamed protein product [Owenia fusiformis]